jgi:hypothetical protein
VAAAAALKFCQAAAGGAAATNDDKLKAREMVQVELLQVPKTLKRLPRRRKKLLLSFKTVFLDDFKEKIRIFLFAEGSQEVGGRRQTHEEAEEAEEAF